MGMAVKSINKFIEKSYLKGYCNQFTFGGIESASVVYLNKKGLLEARNYHIVVLDKSNPEFKIKVISRFFERKKKNLIENKDGMHPKIKYSYKDQKGKKKRFAMQIFSMNNLNQNHQCPSAPKFIRNFEEFCNCY